MNTKDALWTDSLRHHLAERSKSLKPEVFASTFSEVSAAIAAANGTEVDIRDKSQEFQEMLARSRVFFRQHPEFAVH